MQAAGPPCSLAGRELFLAAPAMWQRFHSSTCTALFVSPSVYVMEAAVISECAPSCVCVCFFVHVPIACVTIRRIVRSILKLLCESARVVLWWMTLLRYIRGPALLLLETESSFHSCWAIVCVYVLHECVCVCVLTPIMDWQPLLQGPWKNSSSLIQLPQRVQLEGATRS